VETTIPQEGERKYILGVDDEDLRQDIMDGSIASTIADSGATAGVGTEDDPSQRTGEPSEKRFILPSGAVIQATEIAEYPFDVRVPANKLHITPGVSQHSLLSTGKYADANYITVFDKDTVNIYDANDTIITVTRDAILRRHLAGMAEKEQQVVAYTTGGSSTKLKYRHHHRQPTPNRVPAGSTTHPRSHP
jgi:hypothetical protein